MKPQKKKEKKIFSGLKNFIIQSMSVSDYASIRKCKNLGNVRVREYQDLVNVKVRYCQSEIKSKNK